MIVSMARESSADFFFATFAVELIDTDYDRKREDAGGTALQRCG